MVRTQIQLEEIQHRQLRALGARAGKGLAEQVREAVAQYLVARSAPEPLVAVLGKFPPKSGPRLKAHDQDYVATLR